MNRLRALLLVGLVVALAAASASSGQAAQPVLRHPDPLLTGVTLDYVSPIPSPTGGYALLAPLSMDVIHASVLDLKFLEYAKRDDLGGFVPAPLGWLALGTGEHGGGGRCLHCLSLAAQIKLYRQQAGGKINSYTFLHGLGPGTGTGGRQLPQIVGPQPPLGPTVVPPANRGFGGNPKPPKKRKPPKRPRPGGKGDCGTAGLSIKSNLRHCRIYVVNRAPGDATFEQMTIKNTSGQRYLLKLRATGQANALWNDLQMGVWLRGETPPQPLPPLRFWTRGFNRLIMLGPGQTIRLTIELYLPVFAGNADQRQTAVIDFVWRAVGRPAS